MNDFKFAKQVIQVFEEVEIVNINVIHNESKLFKNSLVGANLFALLYHISEGKDDVIKFFLIDEQIAISNKFNSNFDAISYRYPDETLDNKKHIYKVLLKLFIRYQKIHNNEWTEQDMFTLLMEKNRKYGNAVLEPKRFFSQKISIEDVILSRIDEKISRRIQNDSKEDEDIVVDIIGYLIFLNILYLD